LNPRDVVPHLSEYHRALLGASSISDAVAQERGYFTAIRKAELETLGFKRFQQSVPALVIPIRNAAGEIVNYQIRPDQPRIGENGKPVKYESPAGITPTLDVPARCREGLRSRHTPLWITEGARKADAAATAGLCCVSLPGVWSWAKRLNGDAHQVLPDLQRVRLDERKVLVAFDSDVMEKPQVHKALDALNDFLVSQGALVRFCYLPEIEPGDKTGLDDFLARDSVEALWEHVEDGLRPPPAPKDKRGPAMPTAVLLGAVEKFLGTYVRFSDAHSRIATTLYVLHTWAVTAADATPYMYVKSPMKRSGKTRLLEILQLACRDALLAASITEAAIFQTIAAKKPTLLIDEVDALFTSRSERAELIRGVLNAGNRRGSLAIRGSQNGEPLSFETFCPKVLAGIDTGRLPDTIRDRSIVIPLERKKREEQVERLRVRDVESQVEELRKRLEEWAAYHVQQLERVRPEPILEVSDRLDEAWEPLVAIAELAGGDWAARARAAAVALAGVGEEVGEEDHGELLLGALQKLFGEREAMFTSEVCEALNGDDELPFGGYRKDQGIDGRRLSGMLRPYGIKPKTVRTDAGTAKGYRREWFTEAWERYTHRESVRAQDAAEEPSQASQRHNSPENGSVEPKAAVTAVTPSVTDPSHVDPALQSRNGGGCDGVTDVTDQPPPGAHTHIDGEPLWKSAPSRPLRPGE
jgi:hypothetical protein